LTGCACDRDQHTITELISLPEEGHNLVDVEQAQDCTSRLVRIPGEQFIISHYKVVVNLHETIIGETNVIIGLKLYMLILTHWL